MGNKQLLFVFLWFVSIFCLCSVLSLICMALFCSSANDFMVYFSRWAENSCLLLFLVYCYTLPHVPFYLSFAQCSFANHFLFTFQIVLSLIKIIDWLR